MPWLIPLVTLTAMEIVLGIDNIIFLTIVVGKLPAKQQANARRVGLALALGMRLLLLFAIAWIMRLTTTLFLLSDLGIPVEWTGTEVPINGKSLILIVGGLFLMAKSTHEIHEKLEGAGEMPTGKAASTFTMAIVQIVILDLVFSLDSVITAVGMVDPVHDYGIWVIVTAMFIAVGVMLVFAGAIGAFVQRHPTLKMLALAFLILIGFMLVAEGFSQHIPRGYIYFAMAFAFGVEMLNLRLRKQGEPVHLKEPERRT